MRRELRYALVWLAAFAVFALTAYPTITWWDSSSYSLAAVTLGITQPPGSLLLTLLGWAITRLPTGLTPAHALNLLAGALAATTVTLVLGIALRLLRHTGSSTDTTAGHGSAVAAAGAAAGALAFAFSTTLWQYAVQLSPYVLTTVFTALLLWTLVRWWERAADDRSWRWLLLLGLLFGLDYSVHRTNALLIPGAALWILIRRPRIVVSARAWVAAVGGLVAGLALQLLVIPLAATHPVLNFGNPSTWSRFYDYESLAQYGGGFLVQFYPRHAPVWLVQAMDLIHVFGANFFWRSGRWAILGVLPVLLGALGWLALWRRDRRLAVAFLVLLVLQAAVAYFNIPARYFRSLDRHYLPVFVTWGVLVCCGAAEVAGWLHVLSTRARWPAVQWVSAVLVLAPASQLAHNWRANDAAHRTFAEDFATNLLSGLPPSAILFTVGDNDTFPLLYMQAVAHVRPDVQVVNLPLANAPWYLDQLTRRDRAFPLTPGYGESHSLQAWTDTTLVIPVAGRPVQFDLPDDFVLPRSISVDVAPTIAGQYVLLQDLVLLEILKHNNWRRPLCISTTANAPGLSGFAPYARLDGLFWRIVPRAHAPVNRAVLGANLLVTYRYRGYADPGVLLDDVARIMGRNYYAPLLALARAESAAGAVERCRRWRETVLRALPLARLEPGASVQQEIAGACTVPTMRRP
jgi:hypothetical protein